MSCFRIRNRHDLVQLLVTVSEFVQPWGLSRSVEVTSIGMSQVTYIRRRVTIDSTENMGAYPDTVPSNFDGVIISTRTQGNHVFAAVDTTASLTNTIQDHHHRNHLLLLPKLSAKPNPVYNYRCGLFTASNAIPSPLRHAAKHLVESHTLRHVNERITKSSWPTSSPACVWASEQAKSHTTVLKRHRTQHDFHAAPTYTANHTHNRVLESDLNTTSSDNFPVYKRIRTTAFVCAISSY